MELSKDDWELTMNDLKSQRTQLMLQLAVVDFGINGIETLVAETEWPVKEKLEETFWDNEKDEIKKD